MSAFDAIAERAVAPLERTFSGACDYRPGGAGEPIAVRAIDTPEAQTVGQSGMIELRHEIHVSRALLVVTPSRGDTLTFTDTGETFIVQQHEPDGPFWRLIVRKGGS